MADIKVKNKSGVPIGYTDVDVISIPDLDTDDNIEYWNVEFSTLNATANGEYKASGNNVWNKVNVDVPPELASKLIDRTITTITAEDLAEVTVIGDYALYNCKSLTSITLPSALTRIGDFAFTECTNLSSPIIIPNSVTYIGNNAFRGCTSLSSVTLSSSLTSLYPYLFQNCTSLTSITIPANISSIADYVFSNCTSLTSITLLNFAPPTIQSHTFSNVPLTMNIYVPASSVDTYKSSQYWSDRADHIFAISE